MDLQRTRKQSNKIRDATKIILEGATDGTEKALGEIAEYLRQTKTGEMTQALAINYIDLSVKFYQEKKPDPTVQEQLAEAGYSNLLRRLQFKRIGGNRSERY